MEYINIAYVISAVFFIIGIKMLSHPRSARKGNAISALGMLIAILSTLYTENILKYELIIFGLFLGSLIGFLAAKRVQMTQMPQLVAIFNGLGGGASALIASSEFYNIYMQSPAKFIIVTILLSVIIGTLTLSGSFIAFGKLQGFISGKSISLPGHQIINFLLLIALISVGISILFQVSNVKFFYAIIIFSIILGITLTIPIGGADMPVVISLLNSYSGIAASATGFVLMNNALIISGALVGASGLILTQIMCKGMNRSITNVIFGSIDSNVENEKSSHGQELNIKSYSTEEGAMIFEAAEKVIIVPGYGLAVAQAQHAVREVAEWLESKGKKVLYAIHPVAGRMPGHMNVLLAEANIPYEQLKDLDEINPEFEDCDVALILGANDVVNPAARHDETSPIYGMPILNVDKARTVIINKRSMNPGFAGIQNELFGYDNSIMIFGDAKDMLNNLIGDLKEL